MHPVRFSPGFSSTSRCFLRGCRSIPYPAKPNKRDDNSPNRDHYGVMSFEAGGIRKCRLGFPSIGSHTEIYNRPSAR